MVVAADLVPAYVTQMIRSQPDLFSKGHILGEANGIALTESV